MSNKITRRNWFAQAGLATGAAMSMHSAGMAAEAYPRNLTKQDIDRWMKELSNWGRWGADDQAGTINTITPAKRKAAAGLVKDGVSVSMSLDADKPPQGYVPEPAPPPPPPGAEAGAGGRGGRGGRGGGGNRPRYTWEHAMRGGGGARQEGYVVDSFSVSFHGNNTTHLDALSHFIWGGAFYNGFKAAEVVTDWGVTKDDVMPYKDGIFTRGVLIDMPLMKGVPYLGDDEAVFPEDLEAWEKKAKLKIGPGDAILLRTGRWKRVLDTEKGPLNLNRATPGLYASCIKWLKERDIAILGSDVVQDVRPSRVEGVNQPFHQVFLVAVGTPLIDNMELEAVAAAASQRSRWEFLFTAAPLRIPGATGGPFNPIATF